MKKRLSEHGGLNLIKVMSKYKIVLLESRFIKHEKPLYIKYADGSEIDFNNEGIGYVVTRELAKIPVFLKNILEKGYDKSHYSGCMTGPVNLGDDTLLAEDLADVWVMETHTIIPVKDFYDICVQIAEKSLEAITVFNLKASGKIDNQWEEDIKSYLPKLKQLRDQ